MGKLSPDEYINNCVSCSSKTGNCAPKIPSSESVYTIQSTRAIFKKCIRFKPQPEAQTLIQESNPTRSQLTRLSVIRSSIKNTVIIELS